MALRPGSKSAVALWTTGSVADYTAALQHYEECVVRLDGNGSKSTRGLVRLDSWFRTQLPSKVAKNGQMSKEDVVKVMQWKLGRGKFRPLMARLQGNSEADVVRCTKAAFQRRPLTPKARVNALTQLAAVGPATASAFLEAFDSTQFAFFADEAVDATGIGRDYTLPRFLDFNALMVEKARDLGGTWTPALVSRALWSAAKCAVFEIAMKKTIEHRTPELIDMNASPKRRRTK